MTYSLPFGLKQKPLRKYFDGGSITFSVISGTMYYTVTKTTKKVKLPLFTKEVKSKQQLDQLLAVKSLSEIHALEVVQ